MADNEKPASKGSAADAKAAPSLYKTLEDAAENALSAGDHATYAALHPVVVALANFKFMASQVPHHVTPSKDVAAMLDRIKSL